ncbi:protein-L-isoaspartate O-methyltransferase family protein [Thiofilum flexile]|uniref:protein-L-isoaspartate O-methyltransferase family protein n=1 Tax=Thiofilum flexile TaxID=125627 RepID=UPI00039C9E64|nr:protein-L-isoaspartate O-methyltransferase [Thiofilum flexile]
MNLEQARTNMIEQQLRPWGVLNQTILNILNDIPREKFVPHQWKDLAFAEVAVPIGHGQVMMTPGIEARMLQALDIKTNDLCLEIGTGTGFITACMAQLGREVDSIELFSDFTRKAKTHLHDLGIHNVNLSVGNILQDWQKFQTPQYDVIAVTASLPKTLPELEQQLVIGGRMFVVIGAHYPMQAWLITREDQDEFERRPLFETELPPLSGMNTEAVFEF